MRFDEVLDEDSLTVHWTVCAPSLRLTLKPVRLLRHALLQCGIEKIIHAQLQSGRHRGTCMRVHLWSGQHRWIWTLLCVRKCLRAILREWAAVDIVGRHRFPTADTCNRFKLLEPSQFLQGRIVQEAVDTAAMHCAQTCTHAHVRTRASPEEFAPEARHTNVQDPNITPSKNPPTFPTPLKRDPKCYNPIRDSRFPNTINH